MKGAKEGAYINIKVENDRISADVRGTGRDVMYLWATLGGQICRDFNFDPTALGLTFLTAAEELAKQEPLNHAKINLSAVEQAKEAADHAED